MNRAGSPLIPSAGSFTDGQFTASPQGQLLLDYLQDKFGIPVEIQKGNAGGAGYFSAYGGKDGYGGSLDKDRRVVYFNTEDPDVHLLAHESAHAYDPSLIKMHKNEEILGERINPLAGYTYGNEVKAEEAADYLNAFVGASPAHTRLTSEALAQKEANEYLKAVGLPNPGLNDPWYRNYPGEHVEAAVDKAYALMANPYTPGTSARDQYIRNTFDTSDMFNAPVVPGAQNLGDSTQWDMRDAITQRYLDLGLNPGLDKATQKIRGRAEAYLDRMLPDARKDDSKF